MWTHLGILGSYALCSFVQRSILFQPWGKCLCAHHVLLAATVAARRGIQSEQKLDLVWMRSWKKTDLDKNLGAETRSRRVRKNSNTRSGQAEDEDCRSEYHSENDWLCACLPQSSPTWCQVHYLNYRWPPSALFTLAVRFESLRSDI